MKKWLFLCVFLLCLGFVSAASNRITLLAVSENEYGLVGNTADLFLEIKPGAGRIFIDSFPLTKIDTQVTTRFAKEIACSYLEIDCAVYDFFYTLRASSSIVGGASAGAATTVLTIATLQNVRLADEIAMTGTINSGNLIGPVSGLKEKIEAAADRKIGVVLIPETQRLYKISKNETNVTLNLQEYGKSLGVTVKEVSMLREALAVFDIPAEDVPNNFTIHPTYKQTMKVLSDQLCSRMNDILRSTLSYNYAQATPMRNESLRLEQESQDFVKQARAAKAQGFDYAAASYCYGANTKYHEIAFIQTNVSEKDILEEVTKLSDKTFFLDKTLEQRKLITLTDLEAYMIVKERIKETAEYLQKVEEHVTRGKIKDARSVLAQAEERYYSATSWSTFLGKEGESISLNQQSLQESCAEKIAEAEERFQYVSLILPGLDHIEKSIQTARQDARTKKYALCLFQASQAKAEANVILSGLSVEPDAVDVLINQKLRAAAESIAKEQTKGMFPILGYSYYEYAMSLKNTSKNAALLYAEYAIELSNLDMYFAKEKIVVVKETAPLDVAPVLIFAVGLVLGFLLYDVKLALQADNDTPHTERKGSKKR